MDIIVDGVALEAPSSLNVVTFANSDVVRFHGQSRPCDAVSELIVHETATRSWQDTVRDLQQRRLSVHTICAPEGTIYQHGDLATDVLWHASAHNRASIGCEIVNPYYPTFTPVDGPWTQVIDAPWAHRGRYVLPTAAQCEAVTAFAEWLTGGDAGLSIPRRWPGLRGGTFALGRVAACEHPIEGILAHHYFDHADGAFPTLYAWLRLEAGLAPEEAYAEATRLATGARSGVSVARYVATTAQ